MKEIVYLVVGGGLILLGAYLSPTSLLHSPASPSPTVAKQAELPSATLQLSEVVAQAPVPSPTPSDVIASRPSNGAIPGPTPSRVLPVASLEPKAVYQGGTVLVRLEDAGFSQVNGEWEGRPLYFRQENGYLWTLAGVPSWTSPGLHRILVRTIRPGQRQETSVLFLMVYPRDFSIEDPFPAASRPPLGEAPGAVTAYFPREQLWHGAFQMPVRGPITSRYGARRATGQHQGLDVAAPLGVEVGASNRGLVVFAGRHPAGGNVVVIDHGMGVQTAYFHLSQIEVEAGKWAARGETIGRVGSTGFSTGPHLHLEVRIAGVAVDPEEWLARSFPE